MEIITTTGTTTTGELQTNYYQIVPLTFEEKVKIYMKCSKLDLARMLAERDRIDEIRKDVVQPYIYPWYPPQQPIQPYYQDLEPHVTCSNEPNAQYEADYEAYCKMMRKEKNG